MIREAVKGDEAALEAFLARHFETTMFMRGNLRDFGLGNTDAPYAMRYFLNESAGKITGVGAVANIGSLMACAPDALSEMAAHMRSTLTVDHKCPAILGTPDQVAVLRRTFDLESAETEMEDTEPLFSLALKDLVIPPHEGLTLGKVDDADRQTVADWTHDYAVEVLGAAPTDETRSNTNGEVASQISTDRIRLLKKGDTVVAKTMFNAVTPDTVQIGGVYTPPALRGNGYARIVLALHLAQVRANGVKNAILFSASDSASNAYRAIGFCRVGTYSIVLFK